MKEEQEPKLHGEDLDGPERDNAVDHVRHRQTRDPDAELRLEGEEDTLYTDGIEVEDDSETLFDTNRNANRG